MSENNLAKTLKHSQNSFLYNLRQWVLGIPVIENIAFKASWSDEQYIRMKYKEVFGVEPDLEHPKNFNEKNNWRKIHDHNPLYTSMVDKYRSKKVITERVGAEHTFPLLGAWDKPEQIDWDSLPDQFVLKCNHAGGVVVCRDKKTFDRAAAVKRLKQTFKRNYYLRSREWPYKDVRKKIIAEQYMGENLIDFKNYCFDGKLTYTLVWQNHSREDGYKPDAYFCGAYDRDWKKTDMDLDYPTDDVMIEKPLCYDKLIEITEKMSQGIPFVRVDTYIIGDRIYVGEMTFFPWGGFQKFKSDKWNNYLGSIERLPGIDY